MKILRTVIKSQIGWADGEICHWIYLACGHQIRRPSKPKVGDKLKCPKCSDRARERKQAG